VTENQLQHYQADDGSQGPADTFSHDEKQETEEVFPGVPVVRSNTPRPLSFASMMSSSEQMQGGAQGERPLSFPEQAPSAPPLPEELNSRENENADNMLTAAPPAASSKPAEGLREFVWLFEYGLEMDATVLNSAERLDGLALLYGPALLKGYAIRLGAQQIHGSSGPTIVALVPSSDPDTEVWGVLYRIPHRLTEQNGEEPSLLDTIHAAIAPQNFFKPVQVMVHEPYRDREVECVTYVATDIAREQLQLVTVEQWSGDTLLVQRLTTIARKQKLPDSYVSLYERELSAHAAHLAPPASTHVRPARDESRVQAVVRPEQDTEPLPAFHGGVLTATQEVSKTSAVVAVDTQRWLIIFATYLALLLLATLTFSVVQSLEFSKSVTNSITPLGVPWLVVLYGLLGGCISSIVTLSTFRSEYLPLFIIITWFTRPFVGAVLAALAYLLLTSGFFALGDTNEQHMPFFLLVGAIAGFCEGWIFVRRKGRQI
jgi:cation transport regulator ChaC